MLGRVVELLFHIPQRNIFFSIDLVRGKPLQKERMKEIITLMALALLGREEIRSDSLMLSVKTEKDNGNLSDNSSAKVFLSIAILQIRGTCESQKMESNIYF